MEAFYLVCSIASAVVTSSILSLLLGFQYLLSLISRSISSSPPKWESTAVILYEGRVWHERRRPVLHAFNYSVRYALVDLDRPVDSLPRSFLSSHASAQEARSVAGTTGPVFLLTIPPSVGYEQNPLSVYYCYDLEGSTKHLKKCIAEVTNMPWGERVSFVFNPDSDLVAKSLHVSPFMDMLGNWRMHANEPGENLFLKISVQHPKLGDYFTATLKAKRVSAASQALSTTMFFWLMPQKVAVWIYWQAFKLWLKNVSFIHHPKYLNPAYREEALMRYQRLQCSQTIGQNADNHLPFDDCPSSHGCSRNRGDRWCVWRDAQWPWSSYQ